MKVRRYFFGLFLAICAYGVIEAAEHKSQALMDPVLMSKLKQWHASWTGQAPKAEEKEQAFKNMPVMLRHEIRGAIQMFPATLGELVEKQAMRAEDAQDLFTRHRLTLKPGQAILLHVLSGMSTN